MSVQFERKVLVNLRATDIILFSLSRRIIHKIAKDTRKCSRKCSQIQLFVS